jgi:hypothetical protein
MHTGRGEQHQEDRAMPGRGMKMLAGDEKNGNYFRRVSNFDTLGLVETSPNTIGSPGGLEVFERIFGV